MEKLLEIIQKIKSYNNANCEKLCDFCKPLKDGDYSGSIELPQEYLNLLKLFNGCEVFIPGSVIYGVGSNTNYPLFEQFNQPERLKQFGLPENYLIVGNVNFGDLICINKNQPNNLILWEIETRSIFCKWDSFAEFFAEELEEYECYLKDNE